MLNHSILITSSSMVKWSTATSISTFNICPSFQQDVNNLNGVTLCSHMNGGFPVQLVSSINACSPLINQMQDNYLLLGLACKMKWGIAFVVANFIDFLQFFRVQVNLNHLHSLNVPILACKVQNSSSTSIVHH